MTEKLTIAGRYTIQDLIGQGGMGDVFRGVDTKTGATVAIKRLKPEIIGTQPDLIARFEREGEILRQLNHPNIVKILATAHEGRDYYLVMEYVGGGSLRDLMDEYGQIPLDRALDIALDLADALTRAHRLKVIHRDIKPANILIAEDGTPRLTDFGVAHMDDRSRVTATGSVIGTFAYLSPEACEGEDATPYADIWAFGVVLYEMIAGQRPFDAPNPMALLTAITKEPLPDIRQHVPAVPPDLISLLECMLQKQRDDRIPSVRLVGARIEGLIHGVELPGHAQHDVALHVRDAVPDSRFATPTPPEVGPTSPEAAEVGEGAPTYVITPTPAAPTLNAAGERTVVVPVHKVYKMAGMVLFACVIAIIALIVALASAHRDTTDIDPGDGPPLDGNGVAGELHDQRDDRPGKLFGEPAADGETLIVVTDFEATGGSDRKPELMMIEVLDNFAAEFGDMRVVHHQSPVTTAEDVARLSQEYGASVVIYGLDTPGGVTANYYITPLNERVASSLADLLHIDLSIRFRQNTEAMENFDTFVFEGMDSVYVTALTSGTYYAFAGRFLDAQRALTVAEEHFDAARVSEEQAYLLNFMQGYVYLEMSDFAASCTYFDQALAIKPDEPDALMLKADCLYESDPAAAELVAQQTLELLDAMVDSDEADSHFYFRRAYTYSSLQQYPQAIADYSESIRLDDTSSFPYTYRGVSYFFAQEYDLALADLEHAISLNPNYPASYLFRGIIVAQQGDYARGLADIEFYLDHVGRDEDVIQIKIEIEALVAQQSPAADTAVNTATGSE